MSLGKEIVALLNNPFFILEVIIAGLINYPEGRKTTILDAYLIAPLAMKKNTRDIFIRTNKTGMLTNLFKDDKYIYLHNFESEMKLYQKKVNQAIIIGIDQKKLKLTNNGTNLEVNMNNIKIKKGKKSDYAKASENIGKLLGKHSIDEVLNFMGVNEI